MHNDDHDIPLPFRGRGAMSAASGRYESLSHHRLPEAWLDDDSTDARVQTCLQAEQSRSILTRNSSPDVPFSVSLNPYRGCEHGCIYCYARPSHARYGYSPGLDFESKLVYKPDAARLLEQTLRGRGYQAEPITIGANTDAYQPVERKLGLTRACLQVLQRSRHPAMIITKSALIERDLDILADMARASLVHVMISVTCVDDNLRRLMEPRAVSLTKRLQLINRLSEAGVPTGVLVAPVIPILTDRDLETILQQVADAGARSAGYMLLRLPGEVEPLFREWLQHHYPGLAEHVLNLLRDMRGGQLNDSAFHERMRGRGQYADLIAQRFALSARRLGLDRGLPALNSRDFSPALLDGQMSLF